MDTNDSAPPASESRASRALRFVLEGQADQDWCELEDRLSNSRFACYVASTDLASVPLFGRGFDDALAVLVGVAAGGSIRPPESWRRHGARLPDQGEEERAAILAIVERLNANPHAEHVIAWCMLGDDDARFDVARSYDPAHALAELASGMAVNYGDCIALTFGSD